MCGSVTHVTTNQFCFTLERLLCFISDGLHQSIFARRSRCFQWFRGGHDQAEHMRARGIVWRRGQVRPQSLDSSVSFTIGALLNLQHTLPNLTYPRRSQISCFSQTVPDVKTNGKGRGPLRRRRLRRGSADGASEPRAPWAWSPSPIRRTGIRRTAQVSSSYAAGMAFGLQVLRSTVSGEQ